MLHVVRDDPTLQARAEQPVEETTPRVDPAHEVMPDARCLEVMTHHGRRERSQEEVAAGCQEVPMENWPIEEPRSALWVVRYLSDTGRGGPGRYHKWCRMTCRLSLWVTGESANTCKCSAFCRLPGRATSSTSAVIEVIARRAELIKYQYQERSREGLRASGLGTGASAALTGAAVLGGEEASQRVGEDGKK